MTLALQALITIRVAACCGEWVAVGDLARYMSVSAVRVSSACERMHSIGLVDVRRDASGAAIEAVRTPGDVLHGREQRT